MALYAAYLPERTVLSLSGPDAIAFLQGLVTNDVARLSPARALYAAILTPQGKLITDFFLAKAADAVLLDVTAAEADALTKKLTLYRLRSKVTIGRADGLMVAALWGAGAAAHAGLEVGPGSARALDSGTIFVDPRLSELGLRLVLPEAALERWLADSGAQAVPVDAYHRHRRGLGVPDTEDIGGEACYALEAGLDLLNGVDFKKGCYVGQELTARMKLRGGLRKRVLPLSTGDATPARGAAVTAAERPVGEVLGGGEGTSFALLRLDRLAEAATTALSVDGRPATLTWPAWVPK